MRIASLDHLVLTVADVAVTAAFYERLGLEREVFEGGRIALHFGHQKLNLHQAGAEIEPHALEPTPGSADLCFLIDGPLSAVEEHLRAQGLDIELGPVERSGAETKLRSLYLRDPDGNLVELSEPQPRAAQ
jgi:catechol 2,3-dioxygenase-like lactoylglutathione lyase family enzyme